MEIQKEGINYITNFYRYKLYDKKKELYLITLDDGEFIFLNKSCFKDFIKGKITNQEIFKKLENKGLIITENNFNKIIEKTKKRYSFLENKTSLHIVIPTSRCNLGCTYCFADPLPINASKEKYDLDEKTALKIIEFIMNSPSSAVTIEFQGGEATARFDLVKLMTLHAKKLNKVKKKSLLLTIVSNLTLVNEEMIRWLIKNDVSICTSLDGPKIVHDKNRIIHIKEGKEIGTYDNVIKWIKKINEMLKEEKKPYKVGALMTLTKYSLPYYKEIIDEYLSLDLDTVDIRGLTHVGKGTGKNANNLSYNFNEFTDFYVKSINYIEELKKKGIAMEDRMKELYNIKVLESKPTYHTDYESPCGAATGQITYHSNGDIYTCHEALGRDEFKLGNVYKDTWKSVFKKPETSKAILNSMIESNVLCDRCVFKPYCGTCMVENFYHFSKFNYYPTKTTKHHETIMHCTRIFDEIVKKI